MKKVMQNKSLLHRLIALTMAVVMTLTLVAIDSHFHLFAEEEDTQTIDVTAIVKGDKADMVYGFKDFDKAIKFKIKSDKVDGIDSSKLGVAVTKELQRTIRSLQPQMQQESLSHLIMCMS